MVFKTKFTHSIDFDSDYQPHESVVQNPIHFRERHSILAIWGPTITANVGFRYLSPNWITQFISFHVYSLFKILYRTLLIFVDITQIWALLGLKYSQEIARKKGLHDQSLNLLIQSIQFLVYRLIWVLHHSFFLNSMGYHEKSNWIRFYKIIPFLLK